jgi:HEAT repeat protein
MGFLDFLKKQPSVDDLKSRGDVEGLIKLLLAPDGKHAMDAAKALAEMGGEPGAKALVQAVLHPHPNVKMAGALFMGLISDPRALPFVVTMIQTRSLPSPVRSMAISSAGNIGKADALDPLLWVLENEGDRDLRVAAAYAVGRLGVRTDRSSTVLLKGCEQGPFEARHAAVVALAQTKDPRALLHVKKLLDEETDPAGRVELIRGLADLGGTESLAILAALKSAGKDAELSTELDAAIARCH